ncbi:MAG: hypothetical protein M5T61_10110 [Acidimicrobiia bacterium]|nr:hypothetical protein [Acidimicrobiia bacterium]
MERGAAAEFDDELGRGVQRRRVPAAGSQVGVVSRDVVVPGRGESGRGGPQTVGVRVVRCSVERSGEGPEVFGERGIAAGDLSADAEHSQERKDGIAAAGQQLGEHRWAVDVLEPTPKGFEVLEPDGLGGGPRVDAVEAGGEVRSFGRDRRDDLEPDLVEVVESVGDVAGRYLALDDVAVEVADDVVLGFEEVLVLELRSPECAGHVTGERSQVVNEAAVVRFGLDQSQVDLSGGLRVDVRAGVADPVADVGERHSDGVDRGGLECGGRSQLFECGVDRGVGGLAMVGERPLLVPPLELDGV